MTMRLGCDIQAACDACHVVDDRRVRPCGVNDRRGADNIAFAKLNA
jgi:hypothetical protein